MEQFFKVGDKVTCIVKGHGIVEEIVKDATYPVIVGFPNGFFTRESYTLNGRYLDRANITLLQGHIDLNTIIPKNKPIVNFTKGELVWVSDNKQDWFASYFCYKTENLFGIKTDANSSISHWNYCRKFNDTPYPKHINI